MVFLYAYVFLVGAVLGSFYNVVGMRVPVGRSIVKPRSSCPRCSHTLGAAELIPVVSYVLQGGACRVCKARISPVYPIMELVTAVLFTAALYWIGWDAELLAAWLLVSLLVIMTVSDLYYMLIPNKLLLFFAPLFVLARMLSPLQPWWDSAAGAAAGFSLLYIIMIASKGGMGGGDVKLFGLLGFVLGVKLVLIAFFFASFLGAVMGSIGLLTGQVKRSKPIPFGPFIAAGTLISYFFGDIVLYSYISFIQ